MNIMPLALVREEWRPIAGHPGYEVSDKGRVRSLPRVVMGGPEKKTKIHRRGRVLKNHILRRGHIRVHLGADKSRYVAHLVLEAFIGPRPPRLEAGYRDGNPLNVAAGNLVWKRRTARRKHSTAQ